VIVGGKPLDEKTPLLIEVAEGESLEIELKKTGFKDTKLSVDGKKTKLNVKLKRERRDDPVEIKFCDRPENRDDLQCLPKNSCKRPENRNEPRCQLE
jgi:hypothetical protein